MPQENQPIEARTGFVIDLESRIISAKSNGKLICIEFDANSKLGRGQIAGDPNEMSSNGKIMTDLITRQNLIVVNSTKLCYGVITRFKKTKRGDEKSVLDYFVVCQELFQNIVKMLVDEERKYVLSRFYKLKNRTSVVESDHNVMALYLSFKWSQKIVPERKEIYNLKNIQCQEAFKVNTSNNPNLVRVLMNKNIYGGGAKWIKEVKHQICNSFNKIRVSTKKEELSKDKSNLFKEREKLKTLIVNSEDIAQYEAKLKEIEDTIAEINAEENFKIVNENVKHLVDDTENMNSIKM